MVVGTARDLTLTPRTCSGGSLVLFRLSPDGTKLEHIHTVSETNYFCQCSGHLTLHSVGFQTPSDTSGRCSCGNGAIPGSSPGGCRAVTSDL